MLAPPGAAGAAWRPERAALLMQDLLLDGPVLTEAHVEGPLLTLARLANGADSKKKGTFCFSEKRRTSPLSEAAPGKAECPLFSPAGGEGYAAALAAWALDRDALARATTARAALPLVGDTTRVDDLVARWRGALCLSNDERDSLAAILVLLPRAMNWPTIKKAQRKRLLAHAHFPAALAVLEALSHFPAAAQVVEAIGGQAAPLHDEGVAPEPFVTGADLIALGLAPGPAFGPLLHAAYDAQLNGVVSSRDEALAWVREHGLERKDRKT